MRRIVRIWKRWKAVNFPKDGIGAPNGIGLTVAAYDRFQAAYSDSTTGKHDDLRTMHLLVEDTLSRFATVWDENTQAFVQRLIVTLPIEPFTDLFAAMTPNRSMQAAPAGLRPRIPSARQKGDSRYAPAGDEHLGQQRLK